MRIEHTVHAELKEKYEKLLELVKEISETYIPFTNLQELAVNLLREIGEA